jgi:hypothetical protein
MLRHQPTPRTPRRPVSTNIRDLITSHEVASVPCFVCAELRRLGSRAIGRLAYRLVEQLLDAGAAPDPYTAGRLAELGAVLLEREIHIGLVS